MKAKLIKNVILFLGITIVSKLTSAQNNNMCSDNSISQSFYKKCVTPDPDNTAGWCVPLSKCKIIADIRDVLHKMPQEYQTFILNSKCEDGPNEEHFCCILSHIDKNFAEENLSNTGCLAPTRTDGETNNPINMNLGTNTNVNTNNNVNANINRVLVDDTPNSIDPSFHPNLNLLPSQCGDGESESDKVSNGEDAGLGEFPFMALLDYRNDDGTTAYLCGGSLINSRYILTAAHCITNRLFGVRLGEHNTGADVDCADPDDYGTVICNNPVQDIGIEEIIIHRKYISRSGNNDIALLRLQSPANVTANNVKVICLPKTAAQRDLIIKSGQIAGWGTTEKQIQSMILQKGLVYVNRERQKCIDSYALSRVRITDKVTCATGDKKVDTCKGDSGGPLFTHVKLENALTMKYLQLGVVSAGPPIECGDLNEHGGSIYTNIPKFMSWILSNIRP